MQNRPPSLSHPLHVYLGADNNVWAVNAADGSAYAISHANNDPGVDDAPVDGQTYVRQQANWTPVQIPAQGLVITSIVPNNALESSSVRITVGGTGFSPSSVIKWAGYPIPTTLLADGSLQGLLNLGPGSAGIYTVVVTDVAEQSNSVAFTVNPAVVTFALETASCSLAMNSQGDILITQTQGPNAGKSVNLTYGKWN